MLFRRICMWFACVLCLSVPAFGADELLMLISDNYKILKCKPASKDNRLVSTNAPCQLFYADESVTLNLALAKGTHQGATALAIEIQEIGTRTPGNVTKSREGWSDTSGFAPLLDLIGKPSRYEFNVPFDDKPEAAFTVNDFPLSKRFGTYALILVDGDNRQFLGTAWPGRQTRRRRKP